ncbi:MAG: S-layer protein, partial [archaeon]|nr:S-layer protein [archaeon]
MKGLSVKKLAAVALGGALIGSALAPVVSAAVTSNVDTLQKSDVVSATTGDPVVNVAVGSMGAAPSDYVWAGNIAAKVAQLATVDKSVTITGGDGGTPDLTGVTADVTVGGDVSYATESSKTYEGSSYALKSDPGAAKELVKELSSAQLPFLTNETRTYRYAGTSYSIVVKETIGITVDAKMDLIDKDVEDLIVYMTGEGDFNYVL